jgi:hypothetical protein
MLPVASQVIGILVTFPHIAPTAARTLTGYFSHPVRLMIAVEKGIGLFMLALDDVDK